MKALNVLLALLVSAALAFGVFEGGLRLLGFGPPAINTVFDDELGWRARPDHSIERSSSEFDLTLTTDALGLRDDFVSADAVAKAEGVHRVVFLGDSFVNGFTVAREDLFVDRLEAAYAAEERSVEIVNAGVQGYSTDQQLLWLRRHGAAMAPDLVVIFPYENDIWWNARGRYMKEPKPLLGDDGTPDAGHELVAPPARTLWGKTASANLTRLFQGAPTVEVDGTEVPVEMTSRLVATPEAALIAERRTAGLLAAVAAEAQGLGARFVVCPIPSRAHVEASADADGRVDPARPHRVLSEAAMPLDAGVIDIAGPLRTAHESGALAYYRHDFHLNPAGNGVVAAALYDAFDEKGLVPSLADATKAAPPADRGGPAGDPRRWPLWYLGLTLLLGTLYSRTYTEESAASAYVRVALLLAVVFATAIGVGTLVGSLPPMTGQIVLTGLVIALMTFVAYKLGDRIGTILELLTAFALRGHWYLMPLLSVLLTVGSLLVVAASSPLVAPFIYTLF